MTNNDISGPIFRLSLAGDEIVVLNNGKGVSGVVEDDGGSGFGFVNGRGRS